MKLDPILSKASRFARSGKYDAAIRTLQPEVNRYHGSFSYYYLLGSSCLRTGDFGGALTYFRLAHDVKTKDPLAILGLAVLYLRRGETERAVDYYLDILETDETNHVAKKAMKVIRKQAGTDNFSAWLETGKLPSLFPPIPFPGFSKQDILRTLAVLLAVCALSFSFLVIFKFIPNPFNPRGSRQGIESFSLTSEDRMAPVQTGGSYRYELNRIQVLETYEKALSLFTSYRDEAARINLNRILGSNASDGLKNRARIIVSYMNTPGFDTFNRNDNAAYSDVIQDPMLYDGVHVIWRGIAANVEIIDDKTTFDFLVGYDTRITLEGTVFVSFNHVVSINPEHPLELLGRIVPVIPSVNESPIRIEGLAIHQSSSL
jgi:tetratricopeptide (TPR) repeat protein